MEMMISQVAPSQPQATTNGQASKSADGAAFQKTLVQQINAEGAGSSQTQGAQLTANVTKETSVVEEGTEVALTVTELMSIVDGLLEKLMSTTGEESEAPVGDDQQLQQLEAVLDQMNALLALLGMPVPVIKQPTSPLSIEDGSISAPQEVQQLINVKASLQDTLLQLQVMLEQGTSKLIKQQEPTVLIAQQLQALTAILEGEPMDTTKSQTKSTALSQQLFTAQSVSQADVSTLLQRLSQQTVHPSLISSAVQGMEQPITSETAVTSTVESSPMMQLGTNNPETMRTFTSLVANAAATTSFVVADEFAKSMTGMIVQKFDLTTTNGVSEAKIMLYPENLGQVDVRITMQNGILTAIFQTDTAMAKDMLDNQMAQLRAALQAQGLMVDKLEVSQGQSAAQLFQQQNGQGSNQQQSSNRQTMNGDDSASEAQFETDKIEQATIQGLGFGRGINVRA